MPNRHELLQARAAAEAAVPMHATTRPMRTRGIDLDDATADECFNQCILVGSLNASGLFKLTKLTKGGTTSDWSAVKKWQVTLSHVLDYSQGRIPKQKSFHTQFQKWLHSKDISWDVKDTERAIWHARVMLSSLLNIKRSSLPQAPRTFPSLQILIDKLKVDDENTDGSQISDIAKVQSSNIAEVHTSNIAEAHTSNITEAHTSIIAEAHTSNIAEVSKTAYVDKLQRELFDTPVPVRRHTAPITDPFDFAGDTMDLTTMFRKFTDSKPKSKRRLRRKLIAPEFGAPPVETDKPPVPAEPLGQVARALCEGVPDYLALAKLAAQGDGVPVAPSQGEYLSQLGKGKLHGYKKGKKGKKGK